MKQSVWATAGAAVKYGYDPDRVRAVRVREREMEDR